MHSNILMWLRAVLYLRSQRYTRIHPEFVLPEWLIRVTLYEQSNLRHFVGIKNSLTWECSRPDKEARISICVWDIRIMTPMHWIGR